MHTPREERIIAGFEDIQRFFTANGHAPRHGDDRDIFERLYAVRLDRLRALPEARDLLAAIDADGLLTNSTGTELSAIDTLDDESLLEELGVKAVAEDDITVLKHVSSHEERQAAEEVANRTPCQDFEQFKPLLEAAQAELDAGRRQTRRFGRDTSIVDGGFFILGGQLVYVAETGETIKAPNGESDARLRVIYSNGTESNLLRRSLQRALYKDDAGRRLTDPNAGPLFSDSWEEDDIESGTIYVLRSLSDHPFVAEHRELIHKIGVTGGKVETRIANAAHDATYLLADVEVIATYKLAEINRTKLERLFHRIFGPAQLELTIHDRFGHPVRPREWFLVPLEAIDDAVQRIQDGTITEVVYDPKMAHLVPIAQQL
ncbi:GIY-YIG nuclease family protein [Eoetvoesia caeni]|nr:GIY-YIG nuclease family protein [Eoetvoesiella caeni]MCI2809083.1 GIY-YIG nuclease family protein [Eoetvoesiella caeni]